MIESPVKYDVLSSWNETVLSSIAELGCTTITLNEDVPWLPAASFAMHVTVVVPIENSLEGSVNDTLDLLVHESSLFIRQELVLPIEHCILVYPGTQATDVRLVYSHPQALGQCRKYLEQNFPKADMVAALSTAAAVEKLKDSPGGYAAIGNLRATAGLGAFLAVIILFHLSCVE